MAHFLAQVGGELRDEEAPAYGQRTVGLHEGEHAGGAAGELPQHAEVLAVGEGLGEAHLHVAGVGTQHDVPGSPRRAHGHRLGHVVDVADVEDVVARLEAVFGHTVELHLAVAARGAGGGVAGGAAAGVQRGVVVEDEELPGAVGAEEAAGSAADERAHVLEGAEVGTGGGAFDAALLQDVAQEHIAGVLAVEHRDNLGGGDGVALVADGHHHLAVLGQGVEVGVGVVHLEITEGVGLQALGAHLPPEAVALAVDGKEIVWHVVKAHVGAAAQGDGFASGKSETVNRHHQPSVYAAQHHHAQQHHGQGAKKHCPVGSSHLSLFPFCFVVV